MKIKRYYQIPENMAEWLGKKDGTAIEFIINPAFGDYGYAHIVWKRIEIRMITRKCNRCGYDQLWNPEPDKPCLYRHTYNNWEYETVFQYEYIEDDEPVDDISYAFTKWLELQPQENGRNGPYTFISFGKTGWQ